MSGRFNRMATGAPGRCWLAVTLALGVTAPAAAARSAGVGPATASPNLLHPLILVLDADGRPAALTGKPAAPGRTCASCHDAGFIEGHSSHWNDRTKVACVECHVGGALPTDPAAFDVEGRLRREFVRISAPADEDCGRCHGLVHSGSEPLRIPEDFEDRSSAPQISPYLTLATGAVFSAQDVSTSFLNLAGKEALTRPWDVHARRRVGCIACHFAPNNPVHGTVKDSSLAVLVNDPRRLSFSEYLRRPDHRLAAADCRSCHDPLAAHAFLPYRERHFATLACEACHVPRLEGPAARSVDATVVSADGSPLVEYRGADRRGGESLNAAYLEGYAPLLLPARQPDGTTRLSPFNAVERWMWTSGPGGPEVAFETVRAALLLESGNPGRPELRLDSAAKAGLVRDRLVARGVQDPRLSSLVTLYPVRHGIVAGEAVQRDCSACHARNSRLSAALPLGASKPVGTEAGAPPRVLVASGGKVVDAAVAGIAARVAMEGETRVVRAGPRAFAGLYVFGYSGAGWPDRLGFLLFAAAALGTAAHGGFRFLTRGRRRPHPSPVYKTYLYSAYERSWHWLMAVSILLLMTTGLSIHLGSSRGSWPLPAAVAVHNAVAVILLANAFLSLFYHVTTSAIRQFLPSRRNLGGGILAQVRFYARGIFLGQPHPSPKALDRKLNPLQQLTYLALLNVLFPFQAVTGALIWAASRRPDLVQAVGGLSVIAPLHDLGAWLFLAFFVLHLYLTTTGHTVLSNVKAMIDGWDEIDQIPPAKTELSMSESNGGTAGKRRFGRPARPYIDPYLGGALLGVVLFLSFYITGNGLGASAALNRVQVGIVDLVASGHVDRVAYFSEMGGGHRNALNHASVFMLVGTFLGGMISGIVNGRFRPETRGGPRVGRTRRWLLALAGGAFMGYGARLARGCTSGQALSGGAVLSVGSFAFMFAVFAGAYALAYSLRRLWN